ncbi:hypothetical protein JOC76_000127 [Neobacillus cucumis]|nr:hypothetical protein [Neobacillus cucumis]
MIIKFYKLLPYNKPVAAETNNEEKTNYKWDNVIFK